MNKRIRILLVEDNPGDARLVREMLRKIEKVPFELEEADSLSRAFEMLRAKPFDIMLLDLGLPDSQGLETVNKVMSTISSIPIIILTGMSDEAIGMQAVEHGAQDFLVKWEANETLLARSIRYAIERKQAEEAMRSSEKRYHALFEGMTGIGALIEVICDENGKPVDYIYLDVNQSYERISGKPRELIIGKRVAEILPKAEAGWFEKIGRTALTGKPAKFHYDCRDFGKVLDYSVYSPKDGQAALIGWDITEQMKATWALRESEERLELAVNGANLGLWDWNLETGQIVFNERAAEILGYPPIEGPNNLSALLEIMHSDDLEKSKILIDTRLNEGSSLLDFVTRIQTGTGQWRWIQIDGRVVDRNSEKPVRAAGIIRDINAMMVAQEALRESEDRNRQIVETSGEGIWIIDAEEKTTFVNQQLGEMLGYSSEEMSGHLFYEFINDEERQAAMGHIEKRRKGIKEQYDFRLRRKDGSDFWAIVSSTPRFDNEGRYLGSLKMITDINERKKGEIREKARFVLLSRLRNAKNVDECLVFCCKGIADSMLFSKSIFIYYSDKLDIINFGQYGLEKRQSNLIKRSQAPDNELLNKISQPKYRVSKSYFVPEGSIPDLEKGFPHLFAGKGIDENYWKPGDVLITPLSYDNDSRKGLVIMACPHSPERPPAQDIVLRLEELIEMVTIRISEIRQAEELANERQALNEKNVALKEIMSVIEAEKMEIRQQIAGMIDQVLKPAVNRLVRRDGTVNKTYYDLIKYNLGELSASTGGALHISSKLSPREMEICAMIKNGASSKDIAEALDIALVTVQKHREIIRKKLGLTNKNINLTTHLRNM